MSRPVRGPTRDLTRHAAGARAGGDERRAMLAALHAALVPPRAAGRVGVADLLAAAAAIRDAARRTRAAGRPARVAAGSAAGPAAGSRTPPGAVFCTGDRAGALGAGAEAGATGGGAQPVLEKPAPAAALDRAVRAVREASARRRLRPP